MPDALDDFQGAPFSGGCPAGPGHELQGDGRAVWPFGLPDLAESAPSDAPHQPVAGDRLPAGGEGCNALVLEVPEPAHLAQGVHPPLQLLGQLGTVPAKLLGGDWPPGLGQLLPAQQQQFQTFFGVHHSEGHWPLKASRRRSRARCQRRLRERTEMPSRSAASA